MPEPPSTPSPEPLQFEAAEIESSPIGACQRCGGGLGQAYYQVDGVVACQGCAERRLAEWNGGSFLKRVMGGLFVGLLGAALGCGIYWAVLAIAGMEIGLIAIVTGLAVGLGVKIGSGGRGGRIFQIMAVLLTYGAIATSYAIVAEREFSAYAREILAKGAASAPASVSEPASMPASAPVEDGSDASRELTPEEARFALSIPWGVRVAMLVPFAAMLPILSFHVIGALIIAFALYEAWKIAGAAPPPVAGPFRRQAGDGASRSHADAGMDMGVRRP
jgi:hypothetical protein